MSQQLSNSEANRGTLFLFLVLLLIIVPTFAQGQYTDEFGEKYDKEYIAKSDSGKRGQLFRAINTIRQNHGMYALNYKVEDQEIASKRAKQLVRTFKADTTTCRGEVIYKGTFPEISTRALDYANGNNLQFLSDAYTVSIGVYKRRRVYYTVIRIF